MHCYPYERPALTVDCLIIGENQFAKPDQPRLHLLLIQRKHAPFANAWALPGGFVEPHEDPHDAALRELHEETSVQTAAVTQLYTVGTPHRDPRGWTVSIVYYAFIDIAQHTPIAADDAAAAEWFAIDALPTDLAFDHAGIIAYAKEKLNL